MDVIAPVSVGALFDDFMNRHSGYEFDRNGRLISNSEMMNLLRDEDYKRVALTAFVDGTFVSTVWIGVDPHFDGEDRPRVFETMVKLNGEWCMGQRYCNEADALQGHCRVLDEVIMRIRDAGD
jgi:hypothetical protein